MLSYPFVIKKDGRREPYSKEKLLRGLQAACQKRPVSLAQLEAVVERISAWVITRGEGEIASKIIGRRIMAELKQLDDVAYVRFASVYRTFKDVQEFVEKLEGDELMDMIDSTGPQLSLSAIPLNLPLHIPATTQQNLKESKQHDSREQTEQHPEKTGQRTFPTDSFSN